MIANIDFSIFSSPTEAYGNVVGRIDIPQNVNVGDQVIVLDTISVNGFPGSLRVLSMQKLEDETVLLALDDVVLESVDTAKVLVQKLESEAGLFFDPYH